MDSNTYSTRQTVGTSAGLSAVVAELQGLADQAVGGLSDGARAERLMTLRGLMDRLEGQWLADLADLDARGAAGADQGVEAGSTAAWLRNRLHMSAGTAASLVRTARALYRGPLTGTGQALTDGEISPAHAQVLAAGTQELPDHVAVAAEPVLVQAARRLDPPRLRRVVAHLRLVADPDGTETQGERRHRQRGLWLASTWEGMVALQGLLEPEAGQLLVAALEPLAHPQDAQDPRSASQRRADALAELARRTLEGGRLPQRGGVRPQLAVTVDLDSLLSHHGGLGGEIGRVGPLNPEACRRLACDGAVTRVVVTRHGTHPLHDPHTHEHSGARDPTDLVEGLAGRLRAALALLPPDPGWCGHPAAGGGPDQPGRLGRPTHRPGGR
jgi:Domain of unknown function (DUF222)